LVFEFVMNAHIEIAKRLLTGFQLFGPAMKNYTGLQNPWLFGQRMVSGSTGPEAKRGGSDLKCAPQAGLETTTLRLTVATVNARFNCCELLQTTIGVAFSPPVPEAPLLPTAVFDDLFSRTVVTIVSTLRPPSYLHRPLESSGWI
jgi:hypothetical protein